MAVENKINKKSNKNIILIAVAVIIAVVAIAVIFVKFYSTTVPVSNQSVYNTTVPVSNQSAIQNSSAAKSQFVNDVGKFNSTSNIKIIYNMTALNPPSALNSSSSSSQFFITYYKSGNNQSVAITPRASTFSSPVSFYFIGGKSLECTSIPSISGKVNPECILYNAPQLFNFPEITNIIFASNPITTILYHNQSSVNGRACSIFTISVPEREAVNSLQLPPSLVASILNTSIVTTECLDNQYGYPSFMSTAMQNRTSAKSITEFNLVAENISLGNVNSSQFTLPTSFMLKSTPSGAVTCTGHNVTFAFTPFINMSNPNVSINASSYNSISKTFINTTINKTLSGTYSAFTNYTVNVSSSKNISNDELNICIGKSCALNFCSFSPPIINSSISKTPPTTSISATSSNTITSNGITISSNSPS